jgi:hypothetical protein
MELYSIKITKSKNTPAEGKKGEWWQYEIFLGDTATVSGQRHGTREEVEIFLKKTVHLINGRTRGKSSKALRLANSSPKNISIGKTASTFNRRL